MSRMLVAFQPGGCGRAFRSCTVLDELDLPASRLYLCGPGDAALLEPRLRTEDRIELVASVPDWRRLLIERERGMELCWIDADLDAVPDADSDVGRVLTSDRALLPGESESAGTPEPRRWKRLVGAAAAAVWWGELSQIPVPERRVAVRDHFHVAGLISGLADPRLESLRLTRSGARATPSLIAVRSEHPEYGAVLEAARQRGWTVDELPRDEPDPELPSRLFAVEAAVIPGSQGLLAECAGIGLPTLCLPASPAEDARARYFAHRHGILTPVVDDDHARNRDLLLEGGARPSPLERPDLERQRANVLDTVEALRRMLRRGGATTR